MSHSDVSRVKLGCVVTRFLLEELSVLPSNKMELKLVVRLLRRPPELLLLDEELFLDMDDITRLTLVGLDPTLELLPARHSIIKIYVSEDVCDATCETLETERTGLSLVLEEAGVASLMTTRVYQTSSLRSTTVTIRSETSFHVLMKSVRTCRTE